MGDITPAEAWARIAANGADTQAAQEKMWEEQKQSIEQQRADTQGSFYSQLGLHKAGQEAENALMFMGEWQKTVNSREEAVAQGIRPPDSMDSGFLFDDAQSAKDKEDNWTAIGNIFNNGSG